MFFAYKFPLRLLKKFSIVIYGITFFSLLAVMFWGQSYGTIATNWIRVAGVSIQPSEFAKLALIIFLANWLANKKDVIRDLQNGFIPFVIITGILTAPVMLQNEFGSTLVLAIIAGAMFLVGGASKKHLIFSILAGIVFITVIISTVEHVRERFMGFNSINEECQEDYCWQSQQANVAIGSGGFWGKGLTQGVQKSYWLPQASDDFIFAASSEELGFIRIIFTVLAYFIIAIRGFAIANNTDNDFAKYLAIGISVWIVGQAFINIAVNTALMPVTGITLPFVSYGGTSLLTSLVGIGILLNISTNNFSYAGSTNRWRNRRTRNPQRRRYRRY
jgi:cell division protein FtsW